MKILKRNQVIILVIALMLVTAGYLNFIETNNQNEAIQTNGNNVETMGDATFVSSGVLVENGENNLENTNTVQNQTNTNTINTDANPEGTSNDYFINSKLERDTMYSQIIESYQKMLDSTTVSAEQKTVAQNEITKINETKNAIMIAENLIKTKGIKEVLILVNDKNINVIVDDDLKQEEIAQIQNIVSREMKSEIENIHISSK